MKAYPAPPSEPRQEEWQREGAALYWRAPSAIHRETKPGAQMGTIDKGGLGDPKTLSTSDWAAWRRAGQEDVEDGRPSGPSARTHGTSARGKASGGGAPP